MENIDVNNIIDDNSTFEELSIDDYYSDYYEKVLQSLKSISSNQNELLSKSNEINLSIKDSSRFLSVISFLIGLVLLYLFVHDILRL